MYRIQHETVLETGVSFETCSRHHQPVFYLAITKSDALLKIVIVTVKSKYSSQK